MTQSKAELVQLPFQDFSVDPCLGSHRKGFLVDPDQALHPFQVEHDSPEESRIPPFTPEPPA